MLIATLPAVHQERLLEQIIKHPAVDEVRYNTGVCSAFDAIETLDRILQLTSRYHKKLWLDLKGRQLRITRWAVPNFGKIVLNHEISVDCPAKIFFRGNDWSEVKVARGNTVYVDPPPRYAVGEGQAINIHGNNLKIMGYLTESDKEYIAAASRFNINNFMLSFVEEDNDIDQFYQTFKEHNNLRSDLNVVLKIESTQGLSYIENFKSRDEERKINYALMAARDDLWINIGDNKARILSALNGLITKDQNAIVASRIFAGLENGGNIMMGDYADLALMHKFGYQNFMLSDGICNNHFEKAINAWQDYLATR